MKTKYSIIGLVCGTALVGALAGCVGYVDGPRHAVYTEPEPAYVRGEVMVQDDYVYYPGYQVYYSSNRRQYVYLDGHSWVTRPAPPHVSVDALVASPSVRLDFHDAPSSHHAAVVKQYPKRWTPPVSGGNHGDGDRDDRNGNDRRDRR